MASHQDKASYQAGETKARTEVTISIDSIYLLVTLAAVVLLIDHAVQFCSKSCK